MAVEPLHPEDKGKVEGARALRCGFCGYVRAIPKEDDIEFYGMGSCDECRRDYAILAPTDIRRLNTTTRLCPMCVERARKERRR
jgi:hypothetical protein